MAIQPEAYMSSWQQAYNSKNIRATLVTQTVISTAADASHGMQVADRHTHVWLHAVLDLNDLRLVCLGTIAEQDLQT